MSALHLFHIFHPSCGPFFAISFPLSASRFAFALAFPFPFACVVVAFLSTSPLHDGTSSTPQAFLCFDDRENLSAVCHADDPDSLCSRTTAPKLASSTFFRVLYKRRGEWKYFGETARYLLLNFFKHSFDIRSVSQRKYKHSSILFLFIAGFP